MLISGEDVRFGDLSGWNDVVIFGFVATLVPGEPLLERPLVEWNLSL